MNHLGAPRMYEPVRGAILAADIAVALGNSMVMYPDDLSSLDGMTKLCSIFGLHIPRTLTLTQVLYIKHSKPALQELAVQLQNIVRYHIDADSIVDQILHTKIPGKWDVETVHAIHSLLENNAKQFHLNANDMPTGRYFNLNELDLAMLRRRVFLMHARYLVFLGELNEISATALPRSSLLYDAGDIFGHDRCVKPKDMKASFLMAAENIVAAF